MKQDLSIQAIGKLFSRALLRFHIITYAVIVTAGLSVIIYFVSQIVINASEPPISTETIHAGFDKDTIEQLESLSKRSTDGKPLEFPADQRINPFSE